MDNPETQTMLGTRHRTIAKNQKKQQEYGKIQRVDTQNSQQKQM